jgi:hypothetical protein
MMEAVIQARVLLEPGEEPLDALIKAFRNCCRSFRSNSFTLITLDPSQEFLKAFVIRAELGKPGDTLIEHDIVDLLGLIDVLLYLIYVTLGELGSELVNRAELALVPVAVSREPEGEAVVLGGRPNGADFERTDVSQSCVHRIYVITHLGVSCNCFDTSMTNPRNYQEQTETFA